MLALLFGSAALRAEHDDAAVAVVEELHAALLDAMRAQDLDARGRSELLHDTIAASFDVPTIVRLSLGAAWRELDEDARDRLERAQFELILTTYAARFADYDGESFVTRGLGEAPRGQIMVRTEIRPEGVRLDYLLRDVAGEPRIFNVIADGYSELSMRRAEYTALYRRGGLTALLREIERLTRANLERGAG